MRSCLYLGVACAALLAPATAMAQSTGSIEFDDEIVVTGQASTAVGGVDVPDTSKAKVVLTQDIIRRQTPGQTANEIINLVPGVSFQNNDPWGSSGGYFTIRGFNDERISQTVDGVQLNDSGGYALYTNQNIDPELIEQVNVNLGTTDVDSPTANAVGSTVNIRTLTPSDDFGIMTSFTYGNIVADGSNWERPYSRLFGMVNTGDLTGFGTKAWFSASYSHSESAFNNYGVTDKQQYNAKIYQEIGGNGDFVSVSGHYNQNRNNFFGSFFALDDFPTDAEGRFYDIFGGYPCTLPTPGAGSQSYSDSTGPSGSCGAAFDRRYNPSNTGNIRGASRFTLADGLVLTVDPSYQYVKANGGGAEDLREGFRNVGGVNYTGFLGGGYYYGRDLNNDGDTDDRVGGTDPSQTKTHRFAVISGLAYTISPDHRIRLTYTYDRAKHRQSGETGLLQMNGEPFDVFPINDPLLAVNGVAVTKRNRKSYAILNQVSAEYRGTFMDDLLTVTLGARMPFFKRELNQYCYTTSASGFIDCLGDQDPTAYEAANPYNYDPVTQTVTGSAPPQSRTLKYDKFLPNVGAVVRFTPALSMFANYSKNLKVPGTDQLYDAFFYPEGTEGASPIPEMSDNFDLGARYQNGMVSAQVTGWYTKFANRTASSYNPDLDEYITRNLGDVERWGIDGNIAIQPTPGLLVYVFGSYLHSEIKDDTVGGRCSAGNVTAGDFGCTTVGAVYNFDTAGSYESGIPKYSFGGRVQGTLGPVDIGAQVKHTGSRWVNDINTVKVDGYTIVDLDIRWSLASFNLDKSYFQINVTNLFDEFYVGGFGGDLTATSPYVQIGAPRAVSASFIMGF